jgi:hypothetical protein
MNNYKKVYLNALILKDLLVTILIILLAVFYCVTLTSVPEKNIEKLKQTKPLAQQYTLNHFDPIWFYKPDEIGWTRGQVVYLWNYYPVIHSQDLNKTFEFKEVEWMVGND